MIVTLIKQRLRVLALIMNLIDRIATLKILRTVSIKKETVETNKQAFEKQTSC